jgi:tetratricopeptide (TPR) repeat protein
MSALFCSGNRSDKISSMRFATIWFTLGGILVGFVIGFLVASSINRSEINQLRANVESAKRSSVSTSAPNDGLSDEEIRDKVAQADQNPTNVTFQKNLGLALYRYGSIKNDPNVISEAIRLLDRASKLSPADNDITVGLGNAWFDIGYVEKKNDALERARGFYQLALARAPQDAGIRTDLGMTYFLYDPPDDKKAVDEFKKALAGDPKNEKALQFMIQSLSRQGDHASAQKYLDILREAYPADETTNQLAAQIGQTSNSANR